MSFKNKFVTVRTYTYEHEAYMAKIYLEENKIEGFIQDENTVAVNPLHSNAIGGVKLEVRNNDLENANHLLEKYEFQNNNTTDTTKKIYLKDKFVKGICNIFWKLYFIFMFCMLFSSVTKWNWTSWEILDHFINIVGIAGLFGYVFKIMIIRKSLWKFLSIIFIFYVLYNLFFVMFPNMSIKYSDNKAMAYKITFYIFVLLLPYFYALISYAFKPKRK